MEKVQEKTIGNIETYCSEERAEKLLQFIKDIGEEKYFTAPASSRKNYHNSFAGGLAEHNLNVFVHAINLNDIFEIGLSEESICVTSFLHDIGKCVNSDGDDYYEPNSEKWKLDRGELYSHNPGSVYFPTHQRSIYLCHKYKFHLDAEEYQAILLNDGQYLQENKAYAHNECTLAKIIHMADILAMLKESKEEKNPSS